MDCAKDVSKGLEGSGLVYVAIWRTMKGQKVRPSYRVHTSKGWKTKTAKTTANHQKMEGKMIIVGGKFEIEPGVFAKCPGSSGTARNDCNCRCFLEYSLMTIERFAKATNKTVEEVKKELGIKEDVENSKEKEFTNDENADIIKEADIQIMRSVGAAAYRDEVKLLDGKIGKIAEGTKITKVYTFAGKGTNKPVKVAKYLSTQYKGVPESEWKKVRGDGYVENTEGEIIHAELHWFESKQTGRIKMKVKRAFKE